MDEKRPPSTKLQLKRGEDLVEAALRELKRNPDSPASLQILSSVRKSLQPRSNAIEQVVQALQEQQLQDGPLQRAAVAAAIAHWEAICGTPMDAEILNDLRAEADRGIKARRRQPPALESIVANLPPKTDTGYALGVDLHGLRGTWHRLWAMMCLAHSFGNDVEQDSGVAAVREQFEQHLGRALEQQEWAALDAHARHHAATVMAQLPRSSDD